MKQHSSATYHADILLQSTNENKIKERLQHYPEIIPVSISNREGTSEKFGTTYIQIPYGNSVIQCLTNLPATESTMHTFDMIGLPLHKIQTSTKIFEKKEIEEIMESIKKNIEEKSQSKKHNEENSATNNKPIQQQTNFMGKSTEKNKESNKKLIVLIDDILQDITSLQKESYIGVQTKTCRELAIWEGNLRKAKNIANADKMKQVIGATLPVVEQAELQHREAIKKQEIQEEIKQATNPLGHIKNRDIHKALEKVKRKEVAIRISSDTKLVQRYKRIIHTHLMFPRLLQKEIKLSFHGTTHMLYKIGDILIDIFLLLAIIGGTILIIHQEDQTMLFYIYEQLLLIGIGGISLQVFLFVRFSYSIIALLQIILGILLSIRLSSILWLHLGLPWG